MQGVRDAYEAGRGRVVMRAKAEIESDAMHDKIVVTEIPYGVNKAQLIESIADLVKEGKITGISNVNDETGRDGMRIVVDCKKDANANVILNKLCKMTGLLSQAYEDMIYNLENASSIKDIKNAEIDEKAINDFRTECRETELKDIETKGDTYFETVFYLNILEQLEKMGDFLINISQAIKLNN